MSHLCQMQNAGDRWLNSHSKQVSCAMYVPKNDLFFAIFCAGFPPFFFLNIKLPFWDIDGATPTHSPKSGCKCPHRWHNSVTSPYIYLQIITIGILLGLFWPMFDNLGSLWFDNLGSLWWAKLGGSLVRSILSSKDTLIFGPPKAAQTVEHGPK